MSDKLSFGIMAGTTSLTLPVELRASADGTAKTGIAYTAVTAYYFRQGASSSTAISVITQTVAGAYSSGGWVEIDATNMKGVYRFDVPDTAFATGADWVVVSVAATGAFVRNFMFNLTTGVNARQIGGTTQTGRDIGASVLLSSGTGTGQLSFASGVVQADAAKVGGQTASASGTVTFPNATLASTTNITAATGITVTTNSDKTGYALTADYDPAKTAASNTQVVAAVLTGTTAVGVLITAAVSSTATAVWAVATSALTGAGSIGKRLIEFITTLVYAAPAAAPTAVDIRTEMDANSTKLANLDATVSSRLAPAGTLATVTTVTNLNAAYDAAKTAASNTQVVAAVLTGTTAVGVLITAAVTSTATAVWAAGGRTLTSISALADEIAAAVLNAVASSYNTALSIGSKINAVGAASDPLLNAVPGSYTEGQAGYALSKLTAPDSVLLVTDSPLPVVPAVIVPAPDNASQIVGYLTTFDGKGAIKGSVAITFKLQAAPGSSSYATTEFTATSDSLGSLSVQLRKGARYQAKRGTGGWVNVSCPSTGDSFALPQSLGTP